MFSTLVYFKVKGLKVGKGTLECAVCLNDFKDDEELRLLPHVFHFDCIDAWLASYVTCPICHANLTKQVIDDNLDLLLVSTLAINMVGLQPKTTPP
ncbi:unnamed protein product [Musa acuminata subsp. burmannicoides]